MTTTTDQPSLFDVANPRARGPVQSQLTLTSLGKDTTLKHRIACAVVELSKIRVTSMVDGAQVCVFARPVTDDDITDRLELVHARRFQRNVVARTRGLMEHAGWFVPVPDVIGRTGRPTHAIVPAHSTIAIVTSES